MPISSFYGLQTSLRGLLAHQRSIDVTGHNVANASTVGYSRQSVELAATDPLHVEAGATQNGAGAQLPTGVDVVAYRRIRDTFLDLQYRAHATKLGEATAQAAGLDQAQAALNEPSDDGVNAQISDLWKAWSAVANNPDDLASRTSLVQAAGALADAFGGVATQLTAARQSAQDQLDAITGAGGDVARIATQLGQINDAIHKITGAGEAPNDLLDERDRLLDTLASFGQTSVENLGEGLIRVTFGGAGDPPLVDGTTVTFPPPLSAPGGKIGALQELARVPGGAIDTMRSDLNAVVKSVADSVNGIHGSGGGPAFFTYTAGAEAASLAVAVTPASVRTTTTGAAGGNELARRISELRGGTGDQAYRALVSKTGTQVQAAIGKEANARALTDSVDERRQSASGVSLDEEMTNLIRFQRGYQASARAMSTMDEMLDVLINRTGKVGL